MSKNKSSGVSIFCRKLVGLALCFISSISPTNFAYANKDSKNHTPQNYRNEFSVGYGITRTFLSSLEEKVNQELLGTIRKMVPTAQPISVNRPEHAITAGYGRILNGNIKLSAHGYFSHSPRNQFYYTEGRGYVELKEINKESENNGVLSVGDMSIGISEFGNLYSLGVDLFFMSRDVTVFTRKPNFLFGLGVGGFFYHGEIYGNIDASITQKTPDQVVIGRYIGGGGIANLKTGFSVSILPYLDFVVLGGCRLGVGYIDIQSDIKSKDGGILFFNPTLELSLNYKF